MRTAIALLFSFTLVGCSGPRVAVEETVNEEAVREVSVEEEAENVITVEKFNLLQKGMNLSGVEAILGQKADELVAEIDGVQQYKWKNARGKGWVVAIFRDNQLREMSSGSLPSE